MQSDSRFKQFLANRKLVALSAAAIVILLLLVVPTAQKKATFSVDTTDPKLNNMATISPYIRVNFTRPVSSKNFKYTSSSSFVKNYTIKGKMVQFNIKGGGFEAGKSYSITLQSVASTSGDIITNKKLGFKATGRDFDSLTKEQQKAVIAAQDHFAYSPESIAFSGLDDLITYGLTQTQLTGLKKALYTYSKQTGKNYPNITALRSTIEEAPVTPNAERSTLYFTVDFSGKETYKAQLDSFDLTAIQLYLRDMTTGNVVFDSGAIDSFQQ